MESVLLSLTGGVVGTAGAIGLTHRAGRAARPWPAWSTPYIAPWVIAQGFADRACAWACSAPPIRPIAAHNSCRRRPSAMNSHMTATAAIAFLFRTEHLSKLYPDGQVHAVEDVSISVRRGEYVAIMGPSGSGKSTLLNLLGALDKPTSGEVYFDGQPLSKIRNLDRLRVAEVRLRVPVVPLAADPDGGGERAGADVRGAAVGLRPGRRRPRNCWTWSAWATASNHLPQKLSVGERQRVAIARSLANDPIALLADEPTGNLDSVSAEGVFDLFAHLHREQGMTIVLITHDEEFGQRAQRTIRMQDGQVKSDVFSERRRIRTPLPPFAV